MLAVRGGSKVVKATEKTINLFWKREKTENGGSGGVADPAFPVALGESSSSGTLTDFELEIPDSRERGRGAAISSGPAGAVIAAVGFFCFGDMLQ